MVPVLLLLASARSRGSNFQSTIGRRLGEACPPPHSAHPTCRVSCAPSPVRGWAAARCDGTASLACARVACAIRVLPDTHPSHNASWRDLGGNPLSQPTVFAARGPRGVNP
jgi:hypothetical protein